MQYNISLLVGLKNNLDYSKHFYRTTRQLYPEVEICFVSYGSTDGTHEWLDGLKESDSNVRSWYSDNQATFSDTFNKAAEIATGDYIAYLHNDIVLAPNFLENLSKHVSPGRVVSYTTIEPPIFAGHARPGKIIKDFGVDLNTFSINEMYQYAADAAKTYANQVDRGITFFMCMHRIAFLEKLGGMDNLYNPMFCEDDDLILRFKLLNFELITSLDSICYHFVSKTSRFSDEYKNNTKIIEMNSNKNFVRKWGFRNSKHNKKYDIGFIVRNCNSNLLNALEVWCSNLYIIDDYADLLIRNFISSEQSTTSIDLKKRVLPYGFEFNTKSNDILVEFDASRLNQESFNIIQNLSDIIFESAEVGEFQLDIFNVTVKNLKSYENELIHVKIQ